MGLSAQQKEIIRALARKSGIASVSVFGSMASGTARTDSDLDVLVRFNKPATLLKLIGFKQALEEALGIKVDVVEEGGISPYMKDRILSEAIAI
ncbi:MAG: nucleotidyltransferase family protein [Armatimonadetes bacterium]|nr:nucleotidyltransferase family protein [Armatimonadota bacterium]